MRLETKLDKFTLMVEFEAQLQKLAQKLMQALKEMHQKGPPLQDGSTILFGWVELQLRKYNDFLQVYEPDFLSTPITNYVPHVSNTLKVLHDQAYLMEQLSCKPLETLYKDTIILAKGCLKEHSIYLERQSPSKPGDSGWYIGPTDTKEIRHEDLETIQTYTLIKLRKELLQVLCLPVGYLVVFKGSVISAIFNEENNPIWP